MIFTKSTEFWVLVTILIYKKSMLIDIGIIFNSSPFTVETKTQVSFCPLIVSPCYKLPNFLLLLQFLVMSSGRRIYTCIIEVMICMGIHIAFKNLLSHKNMLHLAVPTWIFPKVLDKFQTNFKQSSHKETQVCSKERQSPFQGKISSKIVKNNVNAKLSCYTFSSRTKFGAKYCQV